MNVGKLGKERRKKMLVLFAQIYRYKSGSMIKISGIIPKCVSWQKTLQCVNVFKTVGIRRDNFSKVIKQLLGESDMAEALLR
jgi:hypothetical protein